MLSENNFVMDILIVLKSLKVNVFKLVTTATALKEMDSLEQLDSE